MKRSIIVLIGLVMLGLAVGLRSKRSDRSLLPVASVESDDSHPHSRARFSMPPPGPPTAPVPLATKARESAVLKRLLASDTNVFTLSAERIEEFLVRNRTNAESLLTAFNVTADPAFLREAAHRYPSNALVLVSLLGNDALPEQQPELLARLQQVSPDNPLVNYLSALNDFKTKNPAHALEELRSASGKTGFSDYTIERAQSLEELYLNSGYSAGEAKALATVGVQEPSLPALRDLAREMAALQRQSTAAGDPAAAATVAKLGLGLSANIANAGTRSIATELLAASVEKSFLTGLDPNGSYDFLSQPVQERLAQLQANRQGVLEGGKFYNDWLATADESQLISYFDRVKLYGESAALDWAKGQIRSSPPP